MDIKKLHEIKSVNVLIFGDFMVDKYIDGNVNRISPEAPVPVIEVKNEFQKLGGAGNVINNIVSLGASAKVLGCIGNDLDGNFIINYFKEMGVNTKYLKQYDELTTITKSRVVSKKQQFLRIDCERKEPLPADYIELIKNNIDDVLLDINAIIISDYAKGSVVKEMTQLLIKSAKKKNIPVIVDPKGKDYSKYIGATLCTPNVKEMCDVLDIKVETEEEIKKYGIQLCNTYDFENLVLTRSEKGISVIDKNGNKSDYPAVKKDVIDVSGAGDTVVATIAILKASNYNMDDICNLANLAAGVVVSKFGTATVSLNELICSICETGEFKLQKIETLKYIVKDLKEKGKKIVFTNGCFDLFHVGHLHSFKEAKKHGDILIVAVNSDKSVKENKGDLRPIINENDRIDLICALDCVDYVVLMEDKNPSKLIEILQPDVSIKGEDWKDKFVPEKEVIESYGGHIEFIKLNKGHSTTKIIDKVIEVYGKK